MLFGYVNNSTRSVYNPEIQPCLNSRSDRFRTDNRLENSQVYCIRQFSSLECDIKVVIMTLVSRGSDSCGLNWYQIRNTFFWGKNNLSFLLFVCMSWVPQLKVDLRIIYWMDLNEMFVLNFCRKGNMSDKKDLSFI